MCTINCILFVVINVKKEEIQGKKVIEVGSMNVNGSVRSLLESFEPEQYVGVDIANGPGVDVVCNAEDLLKVFPSNSIDVIVSTELLEHVSNWRKVVSNFKNVVKPGGKIVITTRSYGFPYHGYPYDFWRYEIEDLRNIFSDCIIEKLERDPEKGVFAKIRKPKAFVENNLYNYELFSIITNKKVRKVGEADIQAFVSRYERKRRLTSFLGKFNLARLASKM